LAGQGRRLGAGRLSRDPPAHCASLPSHLLCHLCYPDRLKLPFEP